MKSIGLKKDWIHVRIYVKNLQNNFVGRRFHNETKPWETFHCAVIASALENNGLLRNSAA